MQSPHTASSETMAARHVCAEAQRSPSSVLKQQDTPKKEEKTAAFSQTPQPLTVPVLARYRPAEPAMRAVFAAHAAGVPLTMRDVPQSMMDAVRLHWAQMQHALQPVTELHVAAWLKKLSQLVTNPPGAETAASQCRAIFEVCGDIPSGAWGREARLAWARQPPRNGYPTGARWPSPNELRTLLLPFSETIRRDAEGCRALLRLRPVGEATSPFAVRPQPAQAFPSP